MIRIEKIEISGASQQISFGGAFAFAPGLQIISAPNNFGKSLAFKAITWCLGLEPMFGLQNNDASCFPGAVRDVIDLPNARSVSVTSSEACLTIAREDGARIRLRRQIKRNPALVVVEELERNDRIARTSRLNARRETMKDESGGLQRFLFAWMRLPRAPVMTNSGNEAEVYLENIAPLFFIDQNEGWTDLQAQQVFRYGLQQISEISVEFLLGAMEAIQVRFTRQTAWARDAELKARAEAITRRVTEIFGRQGWIYHWSSHGGVSDISKRWSARTLPDVASQEFHFDPAAELKTLQQRADALREILGRGTLDPMSTTAASDASQTAINLKNQRHGLRDQLRTARSQVFEQRQLAESLEHRIHAAKDVLRLKRDGIGRIEHVECPTCHRSLDPETFEIAPQSVPQVEAHIQALERDRALVVSNVQSAEAQATRVAAELSRVEEHLRAAERALIGINSVAGSVREQLVKAATDLASVEREIERTSTIANDLAELQRDIDNWNRDAESAASPLVSDVDLEKRRSVFENSLAQLLVSLGHSAVTASVRSDVHLDDQYIAYLGPRRLRSLGSASDHPRLIAAYVLALAEASRVLPGLHPGVVVLDEPLQQNPDPQHRQLFVQFLQSTAAQRLPYQTIVFTSLREDEASRLTTEGVRVLTPEGEHFLNISGSAANR